MIKEGIELTHEQQQAYEGLCWFLDPKGKREGRTLVISLALLQVAVENPGTRVPVCDHVALGRESRRRVIETVKWLAQDLRYDIVAGGNNYTSLSAVEKKGDDL